MTRPTTWLMFATHVPPDGAGGGMARYVVELARALAGRPDVDLSVLAAAGTRDFFVDLLGDARKVAVAPALPTAARSLLEREGLGLPVLRQRFDVVHGTKHLLPRHGGGRQLLTVHDMLALDMPHDFNRLKRILLQRPYLASVRQADALLCVSGATRERLCAHVPEARDRARVVPLATSSKLLTVEPRPVPSLTGREFALVVGDSSPRKNLELVVDVWPEVVAQRPAVLAVVGPPSWGPTSLGQQHGRLVEQGHLDALGYVDDATLRWCYENATVVLCPSRAEGFGLPAVEALAFDAPLITSDDPALCEVSGDAALHVPATDRDAWTRAVVAAFATGRTGGGRAGPPRSWSDVADETVAAARPSGPAHGPLGQRAEGAG